MRIILAILCFFIWAVSVSGQVRPDQFAPRTVIDSTNTEFYSQKDGVSRRINLWTIRDFIYESDTAYVSNDTLYISNVSEGVYIGNGFNTSLTYSGDTLYLADGDTTLSVAIAGGGGSQTLYETLQNGNSADTIIDMNDNNITNIKLLGIDQPTQDYFIGDNLGELLIFRGADQLWSVDTNGVVTHAGVYEFPAVDGTANQVLKTDGAGVLTWQNDSIGGGGGGMTSFDWGDGTTYISVTDGDTINIVGGVNGIDFVGGGTNTLTANLDFSELSAALGVASNSEFVIWDSGTGIEFRVTDDDVQTWVETFTVSNNIYTSNDTLSSDRTVSLETFDLVFDRSGNYQLGYFDDLNESLSYSGFASRSISGDKFAESFTHSGTGSVGAYMLAIDSTNTLAGGNHTTSEVLAAPFLAGIRFDNITTGNINEISVSNTGIDFQLQNGEYSMSTPATDSTITNIIGINGSGRLRIRDASTFGTDDQTASEVNITDAGGYYTGAEVEAALGEIADSLTQHRTDIDAGGGGGAAAARFNTLVVSNSLGIGAEDSTDIGYEFLENLYTHDRFNTAFIAAYPDEGLAGSPGYTTIPNAQIDHLPNDGLGVDRVPQHGNTAYWFNYVLAKQNPIDTFTITYASKGGILSDSIINKSPYRDSIISIVNDAVSAGATKFNYVVPGFGTNELGDEYTQTMLNLYDLLDSLQVIDETTVFLLQTPGPGSTPEIGGAWRQFAAKRLQWVAIPMGDLPQFDGNHFTAASYQKAGYRAYLLQDAVAAIDTDTTNVYGWGDSYPNAEGSENAWTWFDSPFTSNIDSIENSIILLPNTETSASGFVRGNAFANVATDRDTVSLTNRQNVVGWGVDNNLSNRDSINVFGQTNEVTKDDNNVFGSRNLSDRIGGGIFGNDRDQFYNYEYIFGNTDTEYITLANQTFVGMDSAFTPASNGHVLQLSGGEWVIAAQDGTGTDDQTLSISNDTLTIENGNFVVLPAGSGSSEWTDGGAYLEPADGATERVDIGFSGGAVLPIGRLNVTTGLSSFNIARFSAGNYGGLIVRDDNSLVGIVDSTSKYNGWILDFANDEAEVWIDGFESYNFSDTGLDLYEKQIDSVSVINFADTDNDGVYWSTFEDASGNLIIQDSGSGTDDLILTEGGEVRFGNPPSLDNSEDEILVYDSGSGAIERRTVASLPSGGGGSGTTEYYFGAYSTQDDTLTVDTWTDITFDNEVKKDASFTHSNVTNSEEITLDSAGVYILSYTVAWESNATARIDIYSRVQIDGGAGYGDINGGAGYASTGTTPFSIGSVDKHGLSASGIMFTATAGDKVKLQIYGDSFSSGAGTDVQISEGSSVTIIRVE
jgi:hypothetical protein